MKRPLRIKSKSSNNRGMTWNYLIVSTVYDDYYTLKEILKFPECSLGVQVLRRRLNSVVNNESFYKTLWHALTAKSKRRPKKTKRPKKKNTE